MRFTAGTTAEGKPAVYLGGAFVMHTPSREVAASAAEFMNGGLSAMLADCRLVLPELACIFLNAGEGWIGKQPSTIPHKANVYLDIEASGDVDGRGDAAINWKPALLNAIGEQVREQLGDIDNADFEQARADERGEAEWNAKGGR